MLTAELIASEVENIRGWLSEVRRDFHRFPELSMEEHRTRAKIVEYLDEMEVSHSDCFATAVVGDITGAKQGKVVALRGDMDALPIQEHNQSDYRSQHDGVMHACGHDVHMTIVLGAAKILAKLRAQLPGTLKLLFQPAEETTGGAKFMIENGCLLNPAVDYALSTHVSSEFPAGSIGVRYGQYCASTDELTITVRGKSAHGARPSDGVDAILIAAQIINALQTVVSRSVAATDAAVLTIGTIHGGDKANIIAENVVLRGTVRSLAKEVRDTVVERAIAITEKTAEAYGGSAEVIIHDGYIPLVNNANVTAMLEESAVQVIGRENVIVYDESSMGGEDFSYFTEAIPGTMFRLGISNSARGITAGIHNNRFDVDEEALVTGVKVLAWSALQLMQRGG